MLWHPPKMALMDSVISQHPVKKRRRPRGTDGLPEPMCAEVITFGAHLSESFASVFAANPRMKFRVARLIAAQLPPLPRPPGRPAYAQVTSAIALRKQLRAKHPEWSYRKVWRGIYRALIPNYRTLGQIERREAQRQLRQGLHWRLSARRRRRKRYGQLTLELSGL
jgi:hypothetical protein